MRVQNGAAAASNQSVRDQLQATNKRDEPLAIVVGYGPVGRSVHRLLKDAGRATVIIDLNMDTVSTLYPKDKMQFSVTHPMRAFSSRQACVERLTLSSHCHKLRIEQPSWPRPQSQSNCSHSRASEVLERTQ